MFTLFKYLVWLVVALTCLMLATISISEFLVESAIDAPYDEKLTDYVRVDICNVGGFTEAMKLAPNLTVGGVDPRRTGS